MEDFVKVDHAIDQGVLEEGGNGRSADDSNWAS